VVFSFGEGLVPQLTENFKKLPKSIQIFTQHIVQEIHPDAIVLFGSRARGDHRPNSDFDIAVKKGGIDSQAWAKVLVDLENEPYTLYKIDLVHFESLDQAYQKNIQSEGLLIYG
jgi:predicted nucleotidyltransferase